MPLELISSRKPQLSETETSSVLDNEKYEYEDSLGESVPVTTLMYPEEIEYLDHWMAIRVSEFKYRRDKPTPDDETIKFIFLPVPLALGTTYSQEWLQEGLVGLGRVIEGQHENGNRSGNPLEMYKAFDSDTAKAAIAAQASTTGFATIAGGAIGKLLGGNIGAVVGAKAGEIGLKAGQILSAVSTNTFESVSYVKPNLRTHQFTWKLVARNATESKTMRAIIKALKYHSSPSAGNQGFLLQYPEMFDIDFHHKTTLFDIGPSILESMTVNFHSENRPIYALEDGSKKAPVHIELQTTFKEIAAVTKESITKWNR